MTGKQVWDALENGFSKFEDGAGRFPQVSGLKVVADVKKPAGERIVSVMVGDKVIVDARGGKLIANDLLVLIKRLGTVDAKVEGRIVVK